MKTIRIPAYSNAEKYATTTHEILLSWLRQKNQAFIDLHEELGIPPHHADLYTLDHVLLLEPTDLLPWRIVWEAGPSEWAYQFTGGEDMFAQESGYNSGQGDFEFEQKPGIDPPEVLNSFSIGFY